MRWLPPPPPKPARKNSLAFGNASRSAQTVELARVDDRLGRLVDDPLDPHLLVLPGSRTAKFADRLVNESSR